jgi:hypothetical protein
MDARDSTETNRRGGFDFAARRTRRAYGDRHASFVAVLALRGMYCRHQKPAVVPPPQGVRHAP